MASQGEEIPPVTSSSPPELKDEDLKTVEAPEMPFVNGSQEIQIDKQYFRMVDGKCEFLNDGEARFLLAACLVSDSAEGFHSDYKTDPKSLKLYTVYRHWSLSVMLTICIFIVHALAFWEDDRKFRTLSLTLEVFCLCYFTFRLAIRGRVFPTTRFWNDPKEITLLVTIFLTFVDIIISSSLPGHHRYPRWSIVLRPLFIVNFAENRQVGS